MLFDDEFIEAKIKIEVAKLIQRYLLKKQYDCLKILGHTDI